MTKSRRSSNPSRDCRIEIRPSRLLALGVAAFGLLGVPGWYMSEASFGLASLGSAVWLTAGAIYAVRELRRPTRELVLGSDAIAYVDGRPVDAFTATWRGPFYLLEWVERGRTARWAAFPDVLDASSRRELRLRVARPREHAPTAAVAP